MELIQQGDLEDLLPGSYYASSVQYDVILIQPLGHFLHQLHMMSHWKLIKIVHILVRPVTILNLQKAFLAAMKYTSYPEVYCV